VFNFVSRRSLGQLALGVYPNRRHDGSDWMAEDVGRSKVAGAHLHTKACLVEIRGDWKFFGEVFAFPKHNTNAGICWTCKCTPSQVTYRMVMQLRLLSRRVDCINEGAVGWLPHLIMRGWRCCTACFRVRPHLHEGARALFACALICMRAHGRFLHAHKVRDVDEHARWRNNPLQWKDIIGKVLTIQTEVSPLFFAPWVNHKLFRKDWLHIADQGVGADFLGNLLWLALDKMPGSNRPARCVALFWSIEFLCKRSLIDMR